MKEKRWICYRKHERRPKKPQTEYKVMQAYSTIPTKNTATNGRVTAAPAATPAIRPIPIYIGKNTAVGENRPHNGDICPIYTDFNGRQIQSNTNVSRNYCGFNSDINIYYILLTNYLSKRKESLYVC